MTDISSAQRYARRSVEHIVGAQDADDVLQEAALLAWKRRRQFAGRSNFETWFWRIARNAALCHLRRYSGKERDLSRNVALEEALTVAEEAETPEEFAARSERERALYEAIAQLNRRKKLAALRWLAGETAREPSEKAARHKAKVELKEMLCS